MSNLGKSHIDAAIKGTVLGALTYVGYTYGVQDEVIAGLIPVVTVALSVLSTKIGDKNTALLLKVVDKALEAAPKAAAKKAPAKKAAAKKK